jgi:hypothetical protein
MATPASQQRKVIKLLQENNKLLKQLIKQTKKGEKGENRTKGASK